MLWIDSRSEYEVECACSRAQCPVRKAGRKVKKPGGSGDHSNIHNGRTAVLAAKQTPVKRAVHEKLKVDIPSANGDGNSQLVGVFDIV